MTPTVGRIVHYTDRSTLKVYAAIVTEVTPKAGEYPVDEEDFGISLKVFLPEGLFDMPAVPYSPATPGTDEARGHWAWPGRA